LYLPAQFDRPEDAHGLMRGHPFASLVSVDDDGLPFVSHLPLHLQVDEKGARLLGHCAKLNPHWRYLQARPAALATFMGPYAYMSPAVYPDIARVPTWNYLAVHAKVLARLIEADAAKDAVLKQLIADHEPAYAKRWRELPQEYTDKMLQGIVAFELQITQVQCKVKLNQHRPESHAAMFEAYDAGTAQEQALAVWMRQLGLVPATGNE